ncbi:globin-like [Uloborus diversus]|uniref:globin-like n=1 Tax=Uloborus diversus TaxID=327109 RepID=UPI0024098B4D|nr:globin-like [Uloborus diversus]
MGFVVSKAHWFWTPADYDKPDSATGITPRQRDLVQSTWKIVRQDVKSNGIKLFLKFFDMFPDYQLLFKAFANTPRNELSKNVKLAAHATSVMYAISSLVDNLQDTECLVELLSKIGHSHRPRNLNKDHFLHLQETILIFLAEVLGASVMTIPAKEAWKKTLDVANSCIIKALEEHET